VSEDSFALMATPYIKAEEFSPTSSYGYGIAVDTLDGHKILRHTGGMVAFASSIHVDLDGGVAAFASINAMQGYRPTAVTEYAVRLARAQHESKPLPATPEIGDPMQVNNAADYAGTFNAPGGATLRFAANGKRLSLVIGERSVPLQRAGDDSFVSTVSGAMAAYTLTFGRTEDEKKPGPVVEVSYGPEWFAGEKYTGAKSFQVPEAYALCAGHYRNDSPWGGDGRVYVLKDKLVVEGMPLSPLGRGLFRVGEAWSPITAEFLIPFERRPRLLRMGGMDYWRIEID
jgi:D-alanyl-D-alanine carboxypeptidase